MPELPEVEVLANHLRPLLRGRRIRTVEVRRAKIIRPTALEDFQRVLIGAKFLNLTRRGKYLRFELCRNDSRKTFSLLGHLGMEGRMFVARRDSALPKHAAVVLELNRGKFVFEDTRYFGRLTLDLSPFEKLGPEPLGKKFTPEIFARELKRSRQSIKVKLLDQSLVAGVGNIYASEALFRARISPRLVANKITFERAGKLRAALRRVLSEAVEGGSTVPLNFGAEKSDGLFYFGRAPGAANFYEERLRVYDRAGKPCWRCQAPIKRIVQAARSTYFCPKCQKS